MYNDFFSQWFNNMSISTISNPNCRMIEMHDASTGKHEIQRRKEAMK